MIRVAIGLSPLRAPDGTIIGRSTILRDITETRSLERQLQQSQKMEAIGQLTGRVAHDFNNLLAIVMGNLDLLEMQLPDHAAALHRIHTAQQASIRCADLTRRLLAFSTNQQLTPFRLSFPKRI
jgi:signal transduction histidine kinase